MARSARSTAVADALQDVVERDGRQGEAGSDWTSDEPPGDRNDAVTRNSDTLCALGLSSYQMYYS